jgi:hypothetical protein
MRKTISTLLLLVALPALGTAQRLRANYGLPAGAVVVETRSLATAGVPDRAFVLWMIKPHKYPRDPHDQYACPEETRGSYYHGAARVSLVDTRVRRVINTLKIIQGYADAKDEVDIPYRIHAGSYYHVAGVPTGREGTPTILWLRDLNGDGRASEFVLYDALFCMGLETALFGYSAAQDRVIQYRVSLGVSDGVKREMEVLDWVDYLFSEKQVSPGYWKFEIDYRGRGGSLDRYEVRYNSRAERFEGTVNYAKQ